MRAEQPAKGRKLRFYVPDLSAGLATLPSAEVHHALHVLRVSAGQRVELFDGRGGVAQATLQSVTKRDVTAAVDEVTHGERPRPIVHLAFAVPKGSRLDWLLEKATELGAASLRPILFERSVAGGDELSPGKRQRWLGQCVSAAKQSGLDHLPELAEPAPLAQSLAAAGDCLRVYGELGDDAMRLPEALGQAGERELWLAVGPEGGLTENEAQQFRSAGALPVRLGQTTLRTETAAIALLSATMALLG